MSLPIFFTGVWTLLKKPEKGTCSAQCCWLLLNKSGPRSVWCPIEIPPGPRSQRDAGQPWEEGWEFREGEAGEWRQTQHLASPQHLLSPGKQTGFLTCSLPVKPKYLTKVTWLILLQSSHLISAMTNGGLKQVVAFPELSSLTQLPWSEVTCN